MKKTERRLGTGITRVRSETVEAETPAEFAQLLHEISYSGTHPFEVFLNELADDCRTELRKKGLCAEWKEVLQELKGEEYDSSVGYSARFLKLIASLNWRLESGKTDADALQKAYELGALHKEARFKFKYEPAVMTGTAVRTGARQGGRRKSSTTVARDIKMAEEFLRSKGKPGGDTEIKRRIGRKQKPPLRPSAAVDAVNRGLKILSGERGKPDA